MLAVFVETDLLRDLPEALPAEIKVVLTEVGAKTAASLALERGDTILPVFWLVKLCEFSSHHRLCLELFCHFLPVACGHLIQQQS